MFKNIPLSHNQLSVILGGLLGDSHYSKKDSTVIFSHSINQFEYLNWKYNILKDYSCDIKQRIVGKSIITGEDLINVNFRLKKSSNTNSMLKHIGMLVLDDGKKTVTRKWLNLLTPLSLAVWWMDDGCLSIHKESRYGKLCTHAFPIEQQEIMKKYFKTVWDIDVKITPEKHKYFFLRFTVPNLKKLFKIIAPYVIQIPDMIYKIDMNYHDDIYIGKDYESTYFMIKNAITLNNI